MIKITSASNADIPTIRQYLELLYLELGEEKESIAFLTEELISSLIKTNKTQIFLAKDKEKVIGLLTLTESQAIYAGGMYGVIDEMYVLPDYRKQKIGHLLIQKAVEVAKEKKLKRIDVTAPTEDNEKAVNFYEQNRFTFTGPKLKLALL